MTTDRLFSTLSERFGLPLFLGETDVLPSAAFVLPAPSATVAATGDTNIDGLLSGTRWASLVIGFSFTESFNDYEPGYPNASIHASSFQALNTDQRAIARAWIGMGGHYSNVSLLTTTEMTGERARHATIRMAISSDPATAYAYYPDDEVQGGDIWFNPNDYNAPVIGNYAYHTFGHELGHALGLKHGHETGGVSNVAMNPDRDSMEFSIMTYRSYVNHDLTALSGYTNETWGYAQSLMMYDIRAIQEMYGASFEYNGGDTVYTFSTTTGEMFVDGISQGTPGANRIFRTIWDGNGTDTYDFSNYTTNLAIDLTPGGWSDLDVGGNAQRAVLNDGYGGLTIYARAHVFNALQYNGDGRSLIENASGGFGSDRITGNIANNWLQGNDGNDTLFGEDGNDTLDGGTGDDILYLGAGDDYVDTLAAGNDIFYGGSGNDYIYGSSGNETYYGESGDDLLWGWLGDDYMEGGDGNDFIDGQFGNDFLLGGTGHDTLFAGDGDDTVTGGEGDDIVYLGDGDDFVDTVALGDDTFYGGGGNDYIYGSNGNEAYYGESGDDTLLGYGGNDDLDGGDGHDSIGGDFGNDWLEGGTGDDTLTGGNGDDSFGYGTGTRFTSTAVGLDLLTDFNSFFDRIVLSKTTFTSLFSFPGNGFNILSDFAIVTSDTAAAVSAAFITYNTANGRLFYNQNGSGVGLGSGAWFATLWGESADLGTSLLSAANFVIQA